MRNVNKATAALPMMQDGLHVQLLILARCRTHALLDFIADCGRVYPAVMSDPWVFYFRFLSSNISLIMVGSDFWSSSYELRIITAPICFDISWIFSEVSLLRVKIFLPYCCQRVLVRTPCLDAATLALALCMDCKHYFSSLSNWNRFSIILTIKTELSNELL